MKNTRLQSILAIASFTVGSLIAIVDIFFLEPIGIIESSVICVISEFLILTGALLGIDVNYDLKLQKFATKIKEELKTENEIKK